MKSHYSERPAAFSGHIVVCLAVLISCHLIAPAGNQVAGRDLITRVSERACGLFEGRAQGCSRERGFNGGTI